jgi:hypothetical protein
LGWPGPPQTTLMPSAESPLLLELPNGFPAFASSILSGIVIPGVLAPAGQLASNPVLQHRGANAKFSRRGNDRFAGEDKRGIFASEIDREGL